MDDRPGTAEPAPVAPDAVDLDPVGDGPAGPEPDGDDEHADAAPSGVHPAHAARRVRRRRPFHRELPLLLVIALGLVVLLKAFVVQAFYIPSGSMETTLGIGDRVLVDEVTYRFSSVKRGDIVVFDGVDSWVPDPGTTGREAPTNPVLRAIHGVGTSLGLVAPNDKIYIKRVLGLPGDRIACCDADGRVTINGVGVDESSYLHAGNKPSERTFDVQVPTGRLFVMGDHRDSSADSREHLDVANGTIPVNRVLGRAFVVVWPVKDMRSLGRPPGLQHPGAGAAGAFVLLPVLRSRRLRPTVSSSHRGARP